MTSLGHLCIAGGLVGACLLATSQAGARPRIAFEEFRIEPMRLRLGEAFVVRARARAEGVRLGSFLLRTAEEVSKGQKVPGFPLYANGKCYVAEDGKYFLKDNGKLDLDPRTGAFALEVSTKGWKEGVCRFAFFASCRPHPGEFVAARHDFAATVKGSHVSIEGLGPVPLQRSTMIADFLVEPLTVRPGQPVRVTLSVPAGAIAGVRITNPLYIPEAEALPGFRYDAAKKKACYGPVADNAEPDRDPAPGRFALELATEGWPPGVHHLLLEAVGHSGRPLDWRSFALKVAGPQDRLEVTVERSARLAEGTHFGKFVRTRDGTLLCRDSRSADGGLTWRAGTGGFGAGGEQLRDGRVLGLDYRCYPLKDKEGWYRVAKFVSTDGGRSFEKTQAQVCVPEARAAMGHGKHYGPLFMRSIVERRDGSLVALTAGWFKSDTTPCPYGRGRAYSRTYVCESADRGQTWRYLTTIGYDQIGSEGYNEGSMRPLPSGEWLAVMRTGNEKDFKCQDNPIMWSVSKNEGRTWTKPQRTGLEGAYPSLAVLSDGLLVLSYGRPGAMIAFSADGGRTWTDHTCVDATPYSGYTDVVEIAKGELLVGFGAKDYLDPQTRERTDHLRLARIRYRDRRRDSTR